MTSLFPNIEEHYWKLVLKDGSEIDIPPAAVATVKDKMTKREVIHTSNGSILYANIASFDKSSRKLSDVPPSTKLLEGTAPALKQPIITKEGAVAARWVKRDVSQGEYTRRYAKSSHYKKLYNDGAFVTIGFVIPLHQFDSVTMGYCTDEEEKRLEHQ